MTQRIAKVDEIMKIVASLWRNMTAPLVEAWKQRAISLNLMPLPGKFSVVPPVLMHPSMETNLT